MYSHLALSENGFLFDTQSGCTFSLNTTGAFILRHLMQGTTPSVIAECMENDFNVGAAPAYRDLTHFVGRLKDLGLVADEEF